MSAEKISPFLKERVWTWRERPLLDVARSGRLDQLSGALRRQAIWMGEAPSSMSFLPSLDHPTVTPKKH